jgi:hypothetical protein
MPTIIQVLEREGFINQGDAAEDAAYHFSRNNGKDHAYVFHNLSDWQLVLAEGSDITDGTGSIGLEEEFRAMKATAKMQTGHLLTEAAVNAQLAQDNPIRAFIGMRCMQQVAAALRQNGDTTAKQLSGLVDLTPVLEAMRGYGFLTQIKCRYRLTEQGRKAL